MRISQFKLMSGNSTRGTTNPGRVKLTMQCGCKQQIFNIGRVKGNNFYIPFEVFLTFTQEETKQAVRVYRSGIRLNFIDKSHGRCRRSKCHCLIQCCKQQIFLTLVAFRTETFLRLQKKKLKKLNVRVYRSGIGKVPMKKKNIRQKSWTVFSCQVKVVL